MVSSSEARRAALRFQLRAPVEYREGAAQGDGVTWNVSTSGALIECASMQVEPGTELGLHASFFPGSFEVEIQARVVRVTDRGFAVRFTHLGAPQHKMLRTALPDCAWF